MNNPTIKLGLLLLWADDGLGHFEPPDIDRKGAIVSWSDMRAQPSDDVIRAAGTDQEARGRVKLLEDEQTADRKVDNDITFKVMARLFKELSPLTTNAEIRTKIKRWIKQSR